MSIDVGDDGCYHPTTDDEIIELVKRAREERLTLRVRGDGHSVSHAIYADPLDAVANKVKVPPPPAGRNLNLVLDKYPNGAPGWQPVKGEDGLIDVDGGMVLGTPRDGKKPGLLEQLYAKGWMLRSTGGIAHQTVAGFIATASAGGSLQTSVAELVCRVTVIDGTGTVVTIDEQHPEFHAVVPHLGLLGIVTKVRLRCEPRFTVKGRQVTRPPAQSPVRLWGEGPGTPLAEFLEKERYARIEWWPQRGAERVRAWTGCDAGPPSEPFHPVKFDMFKPGEQWQAGVALTALGNLRDVTRMRSELDTMLSREPQHRRPFAADGDVIEGRSAPSPALARDLLHELRRKGPLGHWIAAEAEAAAPEATLAPLGGRARKSWVDRLILRLVPPLAPLLLPTFFRRLLDKFTPNDCVEFHDHAWSLLPMDDVVDDFYLPIEFTEIWVPLKRTEEAMRLLGDYFGKPKTKRGAFARTGLFSIELYATKPSKFWLDPAYSDGKDEWSDGALRINPYWYGRNPGDPAQSFFPRFWNLLRDKGVPYRLHWGKFLPRVEQSPGWPAQIRAQYPRWDEFMAVRRRRDPDDIFLNDYWRTHLGCKPRRRIADLHIHYPMHVLADWSRTARRQRRECRKSRLWLDWPRCLAMKLAASLMNFDGWRASWRVDLQGLQEARAGLVLSVLYDPVYELLVVPGRQRPRPRAFGAILCQLACVEADLKRADNGQGSYEVVKSKRALERVLDDGRLAVVHCLEGGLFLGDDVNEITTNVATLADKGVAYVTLAHLWYRGIASNTSAIPRMSDELYDRIFRQRASGLSDLGRAAVKAMYHHRMLIDVAHMDAAALGATFELLDELDADTGARPSEHPVVATHVGYRFGELDYMLDEQTIRAIARRDGVIGLIFAQFHLQDGLNMKVGHPSRFHALDCHIKQIHRVTGSYDHVCIGSDLDGFIKPTISGIDRAADLGALDPWLRRNYSPAAADAILFRNAERVIASALR